MGIPILILAAGASTRMGRPKQALPLRGTTLLGHALDAALGAGCGSVFVVLGANESIVREAIGDRDVRIVRNPGWEQGLGSSISAGISAIMDLIPDARHAMILLGDQPRIDSPLIRRFTEVSRDEPELIIAAEYEGIVGVPALFPAKHFQELINLDASKGAKPLLEKLAAEVKPLTVGSNPDIDTVEDYLLELGT